MVSSPNSLVFETREDVIDFISLGIVPSRENARRVIESIRSDVVTTPAVQINFIPQDRLEMADVLERVYENIRTMQYVAAGAIVTSGTVGFLLGRHTRRR